MKNSKKTTATTTTNEFTNLAQLIEAGLKKGDMVRCIVGTTYQYLGMEDGLNVLCVVKGAPNDFRAEGSFRRLNGYNTENLFDFKLASIEAPTEEVSVEPVQEVEAIEVIEPVQEQPQPQATTTEPEDSEPNEFWHVEQKLKYYKLNLRNGREVYICENGQKLAPFIELTIYAGQDKLKKGGLAFFNSPELKITNHLVMITVPQTSSGEVVVINLMAEAETFYVMPSELTPISKEKIAALLPQLL